MADGGQMEKTKKWNIMANCRIFRPFAWDWQCLKKVHIAEMKRPEKSIQLNKVVVVVTVAIPMEHLWWKGRWIKGEAKLEIATKTISLNRNLRSYQYSMTELSNELPILSFLLSSTLPLLPAQPVDVDLLTFPNNLLLAHDNSLLNRGVWVNCWITGNNYYYWSGAYVCRECPCVHMLSLRWLTPPKHIQL